MAFKKPQINKISADISTVSIYLRSTKKWGKTSLFVSTVLEKFGDPTKGLLVGVGAEVGYTMLDNVNYVQVESWQDLVDLEKWLVEEKGKEHDIRMIAFDTVDELSRLADIETIRRSKEETGKNTRSIRGAFGGFGAGETYSANNLVKPYMSVLKRAGFGVWAIAHTNFKNIKEKGNLDEDGYMMLTSNLNKNMESAFGDIFDIVLTGVIDHDIETKKKTIKTMSGTATKTENYATQTVRKLYFRGTPLIDAGGRFADGAVPEYMIFDKQNMAPEFIKVVEEGIEKSKTGKYKAEKPQAENVDVDVALSDDPVVAEEEKEAETLASIKKDIVAECVRAGGSKNEELMAALKEFVPSGNPNAIKSIDKAKECLAKVKGIKPVE